MTKTALESAKQYLEIAKQLDRTADEARKQLDALVAANGIESNEARRAARKIAAIRDDAVFISLEAAHLVTTGVAMAQTELEGVIKGARARLATIQKAAQWLDILSDLVVLAAAVAGGKPGPILAAAKELGTHVKT